MANLVILDLVYHMIHIVGINYKVFDTLTRNNIEVIGNGL